MNTERILRILAQRKVYYSVIAFVVVVVLILGFGMTTEEAKNWVTDMMGWLTDLAN